MLAKMAMLAEPRRRQKLSFDPRNKAWSDDSSKFGQKLMERMGWSQGKGLGAKEDGNISHVKVSLKNNNLGVGCKANQEDNWIAHQDDFNDLLGSLAESHAPSSPAEAEAQAQGLEARSRKARGSVRYHKFVRGKDLSRYGKDGMKSILGRRQTQSAPVTPQSNSVNHSEDEAESEGDGRDKSDSSHGVVTIKSSCSVQEYFAKKVSVVRGRGRHESESHSDTELDPPRCGFGFGDGAGSREVSGSNPFWIVGSGDESEEEEEGKKTKVTKRNVSNGEIAPVSGKSLEDIPGPSGVRWPKPHHDASLGEMPSGPGGVDGNEGEAEPDGDSEEAMGLHGDRRRGKKKKKRKKGRSVGRESDEEVPEVRGQSEEEDEGIDMGRKKKKNKKKKRLVDEVVMESRSDSASEQANAEGGERKKKKKTKKSKKDKCRREEDVVAHSHSCSQEEDDAADTSEGKSGAESSRRRKDSSEEGVNEAGGETSSRKKKRKRERAEPGEREGQEGDCGSSSTKKKKKKHKL